MGELEGNSDQQYTVLYIEDNPANLRLISHLLARNSNIHLLTAEEPVLGLSLAKKHTPELILLDINLPGMDGYEVLAQLRLNEATRNTPVFAVSSNAMQKNIDSGLKAGFNEYVTKPIDVKALFLLIEKTLQGL